MQAAENLLASGTPPREVAQSLAVSVPTLYRWVPAGSRDCRTPPDFSSPTPENSGRSSKDDQQRIGGAPGVFHVWYFSDEHNGRYAIDYLRDLRNVRVPLGTCARNSQRQKLPVDI